MAGAPDEEQQPGTHGSARVPRLAWVGLSVTGVALVAGVGLIVWGLSWLAGRDSHAGGAAPGVPPEPAPLVATIADRETLPPSVRRYLVNTVYPPGTGRLTPAQADLVEPNRRFEGYRPIPETFSTDADEIVTVRLTCDHYYYEGDDPIPLSLEILRGNAPVEPLSLDAGATREGRAGLVGNRMPLRFLPEGAGYRAVLDPARFADHHGPIVVDTRIEYARGVFHDETLRLFLTPEGRIPARFSGEVDDAVVDGNLRIEVGIDVDQPGEYRIYANLYDGRGTPLAFSGFKGELDRGDDTAPIEFFGRLLRDLGARGPYRVGEIRGYRFIDGEYPDRERIPDLPGRHPTGDYRLTAFSPDEFMNAHKARMIELLMEDAARGIAIDPPPVPTPGAADPDSSGAADAADSADVSEPLDASGAPDAPSTPESASPEKTERSPRR